MKQGSNHCWPVLMNQVNNLINLDLFCSKEQKEHSKTLLFKNTIISNFQFFLLDRSRTERLESISNVVSVSNDEAKSIVFQILGFPVQGLCRFLRIPFSYEIIYPFFSILKRIGGRWLDNPVNHKQVDGDKFVCLDNMISNDKQNCIIYTFGIADDWTFEDHMDGFG